MSYRLTKIYTRKGDDGSTGLADNTRLSKSEPRIRVMGLIDELNAAIGVVLSMNVHSNIQTCLTRVQHQLFNLGAELSMPDAELMTSDNVKMLELDLDTFNKELPPLKEFVLPGGTQAAAMCHLARTLCRRAECQLVSLNEIEKLNDKSMQYVNRLSDLLFVISRMINKLANQSETYWQKDA